jgi:4-amino-4-deoxy-L-arabinose transferase-like glycosyltransferase
MDLKEFLNRPYGAAIAFALLCALFFTFDLGGRAISSPDEGRYIEIPREMVETGDYVLPRLNGIYYFEKPPLFYWMEAVAIKIFGVSEFSTRLVPALLGLFGCLSTLYVGQRFYGRTAGLLAGGILASTLLYYALARFIVLDMAVSVFVSAALFAFLLACDEKDEKRALWWARAGHLAAALAVLSKGLIGLALPGLIGLIWLAMIGRWSLLKRILCPSGIAIFLAVSVPWHVLAAMENKDFLWFYFVHEQFLRFSTTVHNRYEPMWFFVPVLIAGFLPWTGYIWHGVKQALPSSWAKRASRPRELYMLIWIVVIFIFFSISDSKLITYILPIFPPLAVLIAGVVAPYIDGNRRDDLHVGRYVFAVVAAILALVVPVAYLTPALATNEDIAPYLDSVKSLVVPMAIIFALAAVAVLVLPRRYGMRATIPIILATAVLGWTGVSLVASRADPNSIKPLALAIKPYLTEQDKVVSYGTLFYDLPVYLERKVIVVDNHAEFKFGMTQEDTTSIVQYSNDFWAVWAGEQRYFVLARARTFNEWLLEGLRHDICLIGQTERAVAFTNKRLVNEDGSEACTWYGAGSKEIRTTQ